MTSAIRDISRACRRIRPRCCGHLARQNRLHKMIKTSQRTLKCVIQLVYAFCVKGCYGDQESDIVSIICQLNLCLMKSDDGSGEHRRRRNGNSIMIGSTAEHFRKSKCAIIVFSFRVHVKGASLGKYDWPVHATRLATPVSPTFQADSWYLQPGKTLRPPCTRSH